MLRAGKETKKDGWNNSVQEIGPPSSLLLAGSSMRFFLLCGVFLVFDNVKRKR